MANGRTGRTPGKMSLFASGEEIAERKRKEREAFTAKQKKAKEKREEDREARDAKRKEGMKESTARISERKRKASILPKDRPKSALNPRGRSGSSANVAGSAAFAAALAKKKKDKKEDSKAQPKFGVGKEFTIRGGKANVTKEQLKRTGLTQAQYMKQWRATNKRPTASTAKKPTTTSNRTSSTRTSPTKGKRNILLGKGAKFRPFGGVLARALLGEDEKFGGSRGAIDFLPGKSRAKKKAGGGMMKSKMASKGGARGGRKAMRMKDGGFPDLTGDGKVTQADILKGRGVTKKKGGGMMKSKGMAKGGSMKKKGMAKGGAMKKKGYAMGGPVKKKGMAKGGAMKKKGYALAGMPKKGMAKGGSVRKTTKPRGVGAALRGYGKALKK